MVSPGLRLLVQGEEGEKIVDTTKRPGKEKQKKVNQWNESEGAESKCALE